jgi:hypothetical protein
MSVGPRATPVALALVTAALWAAPAPAAASLGGTVCSLTGLVSGIAGKACTVARHAGSVIKAGGTLLGGNPGGALDALTGGGVAKRVGTAAALAAVAAAVLEGERYALAATARVIGATTSPELETTWFSAFYWRMAAVAVLLTLPFLFAAAIQALLRSDLTLLARAAFGYLPLGLVGVGIATPLTMLLLAGADEMSTIVSSASGHAGFDFLTKAAVLAGGASLLSGGSLFVSFFIGLLTAAATIVLWIELLIRQAAVYVIVLMLPLFFAAMVWPARRIWAARAVELLVALILSKFVIVAVLALGGDALDHTVLPGPEAALTGATLVLLAAFSPWALLRLLPLHELAGAAAGGLRATAWQEVRLGAARADVGGDRAETAAAALPARLATLMAPNPEGAPVGEDAPAFWSPPGDDGLGSTRDAPAPDAPAPDAPAPDGAGEGVPSPPGSARERLPFLADWFDETPLDLSPDGVRAIRPPEDGS